MTFGFKKFLTNVPIRLGTSLGDWGYSRVIDNPNPYSTSGGDWFTFQLDSSDSYTIAGAYNEDESAGDNSGKAYIYSNTTGALLHTLSNPNPVSTVVSDAFGQSVAISENYAIVGAPTEDDGSGSNSGKAYIYSTATGSLVYTLNNPNPEVSSQFGFDVSISNDYAIVGCPYANIGATSDPGRAYIFSTSTGSLLYTLSNPNPNTNDNFGASVSISNNYAIVGCPLDVSSSGTAYIYSTSTGSLLYTLTNPNTDTTSSADTFGECVAISDNYAIVGARAEDPSAATSAGAAYIYSTSTGSLLYTLTPPSPASNDFFGDSVSISNNYAIVGARGKDDATFADAGKAYIYSTATGSLLTTIDNPSLYGTSLSDTFGYSVSITDTYAAIGAYNEDDAGGTGSGKAYIYTRYLDKQNALPAATGFVNVATATSQTTTITIPATAQVGDLVILADTTTNTANDVTPTDFTSMNNVTTTGIRTIVSYKILQSGDPGSTITGNGGTTRKVLGVFRNYSSSISTVTSTLINAQATTAAPTNQSITASGSAPQIYLAVAGWTATTPTTTMTGLPTGVGATAITSTSTSGVRILYAIFDTGTNANALTTATATMTDGGTNTFQCFRVSIS